MNDDRQMVEESLAAIDEIFRSGGKRPLRYEMQAIRVHLHAMAQHAQALKKEADEA